MSRFDIAIQIGFMKPHAAWSMFVQTCEKLGISEVDLSFQMRLARMKNLTPGDFEQVCRLSKLQSITTALTVLRFLETAVGLKKTAAKATMGFLNAA